MSQNIDALLRALGPGEHKILDFGCGPGRDLFTFKNLGHIPTGLDGSSRFCSMARHYSNCPVWHQDFLNPRSSRTSFDGVFANASLFHVPSSNWSRVLGQLRECLRPNGILFASNPRGDNVEGWNGSRYGAFYDYDTWSRFMKRAGFAKWNTITGHQATERSATLACRNVA